MPLPLRFSQQEICTDISPKSLLRLPDVNHPDVSETNSKSSSSLGLFPFTIERHII